MFKLQRLEITGFKSFADHTELVFTGEGITAVVGPNGCGKSNVSDAISWVLGEQKVKNLRGGEMKDVIFQGARNRQPSGMAEVVLHMVRDETVEEEADIEDIDTTLEGLDDHAVAFEEPAPAAAAEVVAQQAEAPPAPPTANETPENEQANTTEITEIEEVTAPVEGEAQAVVAAPAESAKAIAKHHGKRHWRKSRLALEFAPGETVSVTRRLYRSGESEYLLNNRTCRLRDIQDLFSGTGLSGAHYAIVEQGRIGQILSAKPMDRRTLIEEAAGITKFRVRQRAAEARLESARGNLSRVSDIISEIDRQVNSLRRQAAKAKRYRVLREELRELLRNVYVAEESALSGMLEEARVQLEEAAREERGLAEELASREEQARQSTQDARALEEELAKARAAAAEAALQRDRREREKAYQQEQAQTLDRRRTEVSSEVEQLQERLAKTDADCERLRELETELRLASEESAQRLQEAEAAYAARVAQVREAEAQIERSRSELLTHTAVAERLREITRQLESTLERLALQAEGLQREGERAAAVHAERTTEAENLNAEIEAARERLNSLIEEREAALKVVAEWRASSSQATNQLAGVRDEASRVRHRLDSLNDLDTQRAHFSQAVQRLLGSDGEPRDFYVIGTLADRLRVDAKWERAVEGVFGSVLQSILVPTPEDAIKAGAWLRSNEAGRASFLVVGLQGGSDEEDFAGVNGHSDGSLALLSSDASDEIQDDIRIGEILGASQELQAVLGRTMSERLNARIVTDLEQAMEISLATGEVCVTLDGDWISAGRFLNAGDGKGLEDGAGLLAFKRELRELEARAAELEEQVETAEEAAAAARNRLSEAEDAVVSLNEIIGREERDMMARELNASQLAQEIERAERHIRVVADDTARLEQERAEVEEKRAKAIAEAEGAETARQAASEAVILAGDVLAEARLVAERESENLGAQRAESAAAAERRRSTAGELRRMEAERSDLESRLERHGVEIQSAGARLEELRRSIEEIEQVTLSAEEERARDEQFVNEAAVKLAEARQRADEMATSVTDLNHRAAQARDSRAALEVRRAEATARLGFVREACMTELNHPLEELARERGIDEGFDLETGRARVDELRERVEGFGAVNMMALEELAENEERLQFLTTQRQDIIDGIKSTEEALREIKRRSRERFRHAFDVINRNFGELFQELFGGGRGEMSLIDTEDVLESGIDIIAQPPGKRLQNVLLLSGGEKAMAALSLVLAIFRYSPSPFCLLDEVDAPLDEANVGRFTNKIGEMAAKTQFIVITHNKRTMEMARALYGVTMEEAGVSKLVSVRFE
jgi:chromosome segregation protein